MEVQQNQDNQSKAQKNFEKALLTFTAILGGSAAFESLKLENPALQTAVEELAKEEKEALVSEFKTKAKKLIQAKRDFDSFVNKQRKELEKKIQEEQEKFTKEANDLFKIIDSIGTIEKSYLETLKATDESKTVEPAKQAPVQAEVSK